MKTLMQIIIFAMMFADVMAVVGLWLLELTPGQKITAVAIGALFFAGLAMLFESYDQEVN